MVDISLASSISDDPWEKPSFTVLHLQKFASPVQPSPTQAHNTNLSVRGGSRKPATRLPFSCWPLSVGLSASAFKLQASSSHPHTFVTSLPPRHLSSLRSASQGLLLPIPTPYIAFSSTQSRKPENWSYLIGPGTMQSKNGTLPPELSSAK